MAVSFKLESTNYLTITNVRNPYSATMTFLGLLLMTTLLIMDSVGADDIHGPGYVGCYPVGNHWQKVLPENDRIVASLDHCVSRCSNKDKSYAVISVRTCYCSNRLADVSLVDDSYCNVNCNTNLCQICGSRSHYRVFNTTERIISPGFNATLKHLACCRLNGSTCVSSALESTMKPGRIITCENGATTTGNEGTIMMDSPVKTDSGSSRFFIDAIVIICVSCFVILLFFAARYQKRRHNRNSGHDLPGMTGIQNNITTNSSRPGVVYQSLILNTIHHNVQSTNVAIPSSTDSDSHQVSSLNKPDCDDSNLEGHADCTAPSTEKESVKHADGATVRQETIDVDADGYVPMDRISRLSLNMECNAMLLNKENKRITYPQRVNYENRDVWKKDDRKSQLKNTISP